MGLAIWPLAGLGTEEWHGGRILAGLLAGGEGKYGEEKEGTEEYLLEVLVGLGWTEAAALRSRGSGGRPGRRSVTIPATGSLAMGKVVEDHKGAERHLCMSLVGAGYGRSRGAAWSNSSGEVRPRFPRTPVRWAGGAGLRSYSGSRGTELEAWLEWRMAGGGGSTASCSRWR